MVLETIKMSSKGQIVIPQDIREEINAGEGTLFVVIGNKDTVILKKIQTPSQEELLQNLKDIAKEGKKRLQAMGYDESDIPKIVAKSRR